MGFVDGRLLRSVLVGRASAIRPRPDNSVGWACIILGNDELHAVIDAGDFIYRKWLDPISSVVDILESLGTLRVWGCRLLWRSSQMSGT